MGRLEFKEGFMAKRRVLLFLTLILLLSGFTAWMWAQEQNSNVIRVTVAMVQLNVAVTDSKGDYVTNLHPSDFIVSEDGIPQTVATFEEGNEGQQNLIGITQGNGVGTTAGATSEHATNGAAHDHPSRTGVQQGTLEGLGSAVSGAIPDFLFDTGSHTPIPSVSFFPFHA